MLDLDFQLIKAFPSCLKDDINIIIKNATINNFEKSSNIKTFSLIILNEKIEIPIRHYLTEIQYNILPQKYIPSKIQQNILNCIYTRHCNGYVRAKHLKNIILLDEEWVIPYIIQLLGEYVIEILDIIYLNLNQINLSKYKTFLIDNMDFYKLTKQRVASYWNCYYRLLYRNNKDYVGFKILDIFDRTII